MRLDIEALVESAAIDCEIWVAKAGDDDEIGSAAIFVPAGKAVGGTQGHMTSLTSACKLRAGWIELSCSSSGMR